jgi:diamine N-acetyltransferase
MPRSLQDLHFRRGTSDDALRLSVLATQVFLDTYATNGINTDLAKEAIQVYAPAVFTERLSDPAVVIMLAEHNDHLIGFSDCTFASCCPVSSIGGLELFRLYVLAPFQGRGIGRQLMVRAEQLAEEHRAPALWLTAWAGNSAARAFYAHLGCEDVGTTTYVIEGQAYENRVLVKRLACD